MLSEETIVLTVCLLFLGLEYFIPVRGYSFFSNHKKEDLFWFILHFLAYPLLMGLLSFNVGALVNTYARDLTSYTNLLSLPIIAQVAIFLLFIDFATYWLHRAFHSLGLLWKFHRLHHSSLELTALSAFRTHWFEFISFSILIGIVTGFITVEAGVRFSVNLGLSLVCVFQHSNLKLNYPAFIEHIFITPKNHLWHHSIDLKYKYGQNFGFLFSWWDRLFGTLYNPESKDTEIGLSDGFKYSSMLQKVIYPLDFWNKFKD